MHIATYMTLRKISDAELAEKAGVNRVTISRVRRGVCAPSLRLAVRIAEITEGAVTPNDFSTAPAKQAEQAA